MKTGMLMHGYHLDGLDWERVLWGEGPDRLGRLPRMVLAAHEFNVEHVIVGTGASERDGKKEAEVIIDYLWQRWDDLAAFAALQSIDLVELRKKMEGTIVPEVTSLRTSEELARAGTIFREKGIERVVVVTSALHAPRSLRDACLYLGYLPHAITYVLADTGWREHTPADIAIDEPPHRPDDSRID